MTPRITRLHRSRILSLAARLEMLEARTLLSAITNYQVDDILGATSSTVDSSGNLWVTTQTQGIEKIHKNTDGTLTTTNFADAPLGLGSIIFDAANQHLFATDSMPGGAIDELDLNGNLLNQYVTANPDDAATNLTVANDGSIWFTTQGTFGADANFTYTSNIGRLNLTNGTMTFAQIPMTNTSGDSIKAAPDGSVWFGTQGIDQPVTYGLSAIGHASAGSNGSINLTLYTIPHNVGTVDDIAVASDGSVWYGLGGDSNILPTGYPTRPAITEAIGHATLSGGSLSVTEYALPKQAGEGVVYPATLNFGPAGQLWFTDLNGIDSIDTATGDITRTNPGNPNGIRSGMAVSATDAWVISNGGDTNLADVDLATFAAPIASTSPDITATTGLAFSGPVAVFVSDDAGGFSYTIDFGNGSTQTATLAHSDSGMYTINGSTTYAASGTYNTKVTITSDAGDSTVTSGQATVTSTVTIPLVSQGVNLTAQKGVAIAANVSGVARPVVAQFSGAPASYSATINWGDSTSTVGQIVSLGNNQYYVEIPSSFNKSYAAAGTYNVSVVITDGTNSTTATATATISAVPVVASQNLVLQPLLGGIVLNSVATFTADTSSAASWFKATINWGDGTHSTGLIVKTANGTYTVIGLHLYSKKGTYSVTTSIVDSVDVESATATATVKIK